MYIHSFRLIAPRKLLESQLFNQRYHSYEEIANVQDRMRWCRHHLGMMQKEVATKIGVSRSVYVHLESGEVDYFPIEIVAKLAALFSIPVDDLLDDYNRFLYYGQVFNLRKEMGVDLKTFAEMLHAPVDLVRMWDSGKKQISKKSFEKYFKDIRLD